MESTLVSIVIPMYNNEKYVEITLRSCVEQTYKNLEIIVVDDGSTDRSVEIATEMSEVDARIQLVCRPKNGGVARAFNTGYELARGQYMTRLAADDIFYPGAIQAMVYGFENNPQAGLIYSDMNQIDELGCVLYKLETNPPESALHPRNRVGLCVMWRSTLMERVGGFDPYMGMAEDYDYWLRASLEFELHRIIGSPQLGFRLHAEQLSVTKARDHTKYIIRAQRRFWLNSIKRSPGSARPYYKYLKSTVRSLIAEFNSKLFLFSTRD